MKKSMLAPLLIAAACASTPDAVTIPNNPDDGSGLSGGTQNGGGGQSGSGGTSSGGSGGGGGDLGCNKMDIIFVIDNSGSMSEEQTNLTDNFPKFIEVLNNFRNGGLDYRVAVTTTSFRMELFGVVFGEGEEGALMRTDGMTNPWLGRADPNVSSTFAKLATVGLGGSGNEQQLRAASAAVTDRVADGSNKDFLREDALLAIVILTDEEDGSAAAGGGLLPGAPTAVADFVASFDMVKGERGRWATAVIAGDQQPSCESQFGQADYAPRLLDFVKQTGKNAVFSSICSGDLSGAMEDALQTFSVACDDFLI